MASQHSWPSRCAGRRAGHFPIILRKLESFNYGGRWWWWLFGRFVSFFSVLNELVFWLEYSRFALTLLQIYPEQASLSTDTYILHKRLSSAKNSRQLWTKLRRKSTTRARQQHPKLYCRAPYTAFSQKSTHFTNLGHHSHTSLDSIVYIYMQC